MESNESIKHVGIYPGSFDPITLGHLDIIRRSAAMFDKLIVGVLCNSAKKQLFSAQERVKMIETLVCDMDNVEVISFEGLLVDCCKAYGVKTIVRGLRAVTDFEYELQLAQTNRAMYPEVDTVFLTTDLRYAYLSSSIVKEVAFYNGNIDIFLPPSIVGLVREKMSCHIANKGKESAQ